MFCFLPKKKKEYVLLSCGVAYTFSLGISIDISLLSRLFRTGALSSGMYEEVRSEGAKLIQLH